MVATVKAAKGRGKSMNRRIRIIKLAERERQAEARIAEQLAADSEAAREQPRDAAATVTAWMGELQQQNRNNAGNAGAAHNFNSLFEDAE